MWYVTISAAGVSLKIQSSQTGFMGLLVIRIFPTQDVWLSGRYLWWKRSWLVSCGVICGVLFTAVVVQGLYPNFSVIDSGCWSVKCCSFDTRDGLFNSICICLIDRTITCPSLYIRLPFNRLPQSLNLSFIRNLFALSRFFLGTMLNSVLTICNIYLSVQSLWRLSSGFIIKWQLLEVCTILKVVLWLKLWFIYISGSIFSPFKTVFKGNGKPNPVLSCFRLPFER